jgi:hypothetical protein
MPSPAVDPEKKVPVCVSIMENEPPSAKFEHPFDPVPDHAHVPIHVPVRGVALLNVAVTVLLVVMVTTQEPVPVQAPLHPVKVDPVAGVAVSVTVVPG